MEPEASDSVGGTEMAFFPKMKDLNWAWLRKKLVQVSLPLGLIIGVAVALLYPKPGDEVSQWEVLDFRGFQTINIITIFIVSGLTLKTEDIISAVTAFRSLAYGLIAIVIITPALGFGIIEIPFEPKEFARGLAIFSAVPTTLASGVALVAQTHGNVALALMLSVCSNLLGILSVPFTVNLIISSGGNVDIDTIELLLKLMSTILVPLIIGKCLRELFSWVQWFTKSYRTLLGLISNASLVLIVWQTLSRSRDIVVDQKLKHIAIIVASGIAVHVVYLAWNFSATMVLKLPSREKKTVLIMASQKTLPVAVTVISFLDEVTVGDHGLLTIPCIAAYLAQLFIDSVVVSTWLAVSRKVVDGETRPICLEECAINGASGTSGSSDPAAASKLGVKMVDNPLAEDLPGLGGGGPRRSLQDADGGGMYVAVGLGEAHGLPQEDNAEVSSSSGSFVSAHTVVSTATFTSAHDTPRSFDAS